jgi:hypothetical protein
MPFAERAGHAIRPGRRPSSGMPLEREEETVRALTEHFLGARRTPVA